MKESKVVNKKVPALCLAVIALLIIYPVGGQINLTGTWTSDDNGTYHIRQLGNEVSGDGNYPAFQIKVNGTINEPQIALKLYNATNSESMSNLTLKIVNDFTLRVSEHEPSSASLGGNVWTKSGGFSDGSSGKANWTP
jgi:hypothetical protein